jgi:hypothetical protein
MRAEFQKEKRKCNEQQNDQRKRRNIDTNITNLEQKEHDQQTYDKKYFEEYY